MLCFYLSSLARLEYLETRGEMLQLFLDQSSLPRAQPVVLNLTWAGWAQQTICKDRNRNIFVCPHTVSDVANPSNALTNTSHFRSGARVSTNTHVQTHKCETTVVLLWLKSHIWNFAAERKSGPAKSELLIRKSWYPVIWVTVHLNEPKNRTQLALEMKPVELHNKCNYTLKYFSLPSKILDALLIFLDLRSTCKRCWNMIWKIFFCLSH